MVILTANSLIVYGVAHNFSSPRPPDQFPAPNHKSANKYGLALARSIAKGQADGTYLVLELPVAIRWKKLRFSPVGCVPKKGIDPAIESRLIHDLSHPGDSSTNACSTKIYLPALVYESVCRLACRIESLAKPNPRHRVKLLKGDVKGAFRLIPVASDLAVHFSGSYENNLAVIDLALPFGWTGSPAHYGAFGGAVSCLLARESPRSLDPGDLDDEPFFPFVWVDDHVLIEVDRGNRLQLAETAPRLSMIAVLGPEAVTESKFSSWETELEALGLLWNSKQRTVLIPTSKVKKALKKIVEVVTTAQVSRQQLEKLLGSLRYMSLCCRATRAYIQRLHSEWRQTRRFQKRRLSLEKRLDLQWIDSLLRHGAANSVSTSIIAETLEPVVHLFMDASDTGLVCYTQQYASISEYSSTKKNAKPPKPQRRRISILILAKHSVRF
ncbi:hypothetical protein PC129_g9953 [Phytophthora cactorum]|uniref:Reverse transcriptase domain-containing protein n=1 Tax=Phytophthora cactorum TaxID=29920 RepID=A0A329RUX0_9STRA|nr:hypothetical protein Pcac1_g22194 [Phytophthora cactorum]KAG2834896.1 hypothetical protein PC112_g5898 [Phytophthora cactorum]KAG2920798.1 hypothetical protein PC114_g5944 [Phytophthora cactorum]KAG2952101.1 hypothetical protein PC117_g3086 [Phytophthora cactorum]KAG3219266.1 hypothetical protein PC129_g9953 [Phytophthora cactorum]